MICVGDMPRNALPCVPSDPLPIFERRGQRGTIGSLVVVHFIIFFIIFCYVSSQCLDLFKTYYKLIINKN